MIVSDDFTLKCYEGILTGALVNGYTFIGFDQVGLKEAPLTCLLRHDIDSELWSCLEMAEIEASLGIRSTFFVMIRSTSYNLFCVESLEVISTLRELGHHIGLHFMGELAEGDSISSLSGKVLREVSFLENEFKIKVSAVSFHQPSATILENNICIGSLINTYNKEQLQEYFYISDTNMYWRQEHPIEIFTKKIYSRIQLLIHPIWWTNTPIDIKEKWLRVLRCNEVTVIRHWEKRERTLINLDLSVAQNTVSEPL